MNTTITARHAPLDRSLRRATERVFAHLGRYSDRVISAATVFDVVAGSAWVEIRLQCRRGQTLVATARGREYRTALAAAAHRVTRQLDRLVGRRRALRHLPVT
jgi:ribosome-associated translation inhibitor RaiA